MNETEWTVEQAVDNVEANEPIINESNEQQLKDHFLNKWCDSLELVFVANDTGELLVSKFYAVSFYDGNDDRTLEDSFTLDINHTELHTCLGEL
jgi:hypothetical protein